jgi:hypothetical protein
MEGVVLFIDDKVHQFSLNEGGELIRSNENALFQSLCTELPVLGVNSLELAKKTLASIGAFSAIILDWQFDDLDAKEAIFDDGDESTNFVRLPAVKEEATRKFLEDNDIYSLIYVYSEKDVEAEHGEWLRQKFNNRIHIAQKSNINNTEEARAKILKDIAEWKMANRNLSIPLLWSATINKSTQNIFKDLAEADPNWLNEIYKSAQKDGVSPELFVIEMFQGLLSENLVQAKELLQAIKDYSSKVIVEAIKPGETKEQSIAKLFNRLFYSKLNSNAPIMTGDICDLGDDKFGIIITPECDIRNVKDNKGYLDLLIFSNSNFENYIRKIYQNKDAVFQQVKDAGANRSKGLSEKVEKMCEIFTQKEQSGHILTAFPFNDNTIDKSVMTDFKSSIMKYKYGGIKRIKRRYKLNSPFLQQLRQRYISHIGRIGVPALPQIFSEYMLSYSKPNN